MANVNLTQAEAEELIALEKYRVDAKEWLYPHMGGKVIIPLVSRDGREQFRLDLYRSKIALSRRTYQNRARGVVVLVRLDASGPPHRNPDDEEVPAPHLHIYREGYGDRWAVPVPSIRFANLNDTWQTLQDFMEYCSITEPPNIRRELFP